MTFTKSPYGPIARPTIIDANQPNSPAQQAVKNRFSVVAAGWNALTDPQKAAWTAWAATQRRVEADTKGSYKLTGYQAYAGLANLWLQANNNTGTPPVAPPSASYGGDALTITAVATANKITFTGTAANSANTVVQFEVQPLKNASRKPAKGAYRVKALVALTGATTPPNSYAATVTPGVYAARYCFVNKSTGQRTGFREIPVTGVALAVEQGGAGARKAA